MHALLDLVFPPRCLACGVAARFLCAACDAAAQRIRVACARCGLPSGAPRRSCPACRDLGFDAARAPFRYAGPARDALLSFKLGGERRAAGELAARMAPLAGNPDLVTFVPASGRSRRERGFDPAEQLARAVARARGIPCRPVLRKVRETRDQAELARAARLANLRGAFGAAMPARGTVLLVDDVMTTGATADACARALRAAGSDRVEVLTFARAG